MQVFLICSLSNYLNFSSRSPSLEGLRVSGKGAKSSGESEGGSPDDVVNGNRRKPGQLNDGLMRQRYPVILIKPVISTELKSSINFTAYGLSLVFCTNDSHTNCIPVGKGPNYPCTTDVTGKKQFSYWGIAWYSAPTSTEWTSTANLFFVGMNIISAIEQCIERTSYLILPQ